MEAMSWAVVTKSHEIAVGRTLGASGHSGKGALRYLLMWLFDMLTTSQARHVPAEPESRHSLSSLGGYFVPSGHPGSTGFEAI